jgi:2-C-methyl-D-erythritol 2,4-cyclodiphosphate synthase
LFRIGFGYDAHRLVPGRALILGGREIPHELGLEGHSDADVLVHAVMDAMLGALGLGDIGQHFPDTDPTYKDASSVSMLRHVVRLMEREEYGLNNLDATVVAQRPRLAGHIPAMREKLSQVLLCALDQVNIKATTTERLGFCGRGEGIEAFAVVSLVRQKVELV